jgi:uncharacterized membrane protein
VNITKQKFSKWRLPVLWKFTDKEISEIKINSVSKNTKACVKILKQLFAKGEVITDEYLEPLENKTISLGSRIKCI